MHVIHHAVLVVERTGTKDRYTPREAVFDRDGKDLLVCRLDVREPVLSSSLDVNF